VGAAQLTLQLCSTCARRAVPWHSGDFWYYVPADEAGSCWGCGATGEPLAPIRLRLEPHDEGYQLAGRGEPDAPIFRRAFGSTAPTEDTHDEEEDI